MFPARIVGHRGGRTTPGDVWPPENTMPAFERAIREGADAIEIDVQPCATGEIVVFHDGDLARACADPRRVAEVSWDELSRMRPFGGDAPIPLLPDVLRFCRDCDVLLNVEMKHEVPSKRDLVRGVADALRDSDGVLVSSFDPTLLYRLHKHLPRLPIAWLLTSSRRWSPTAAHLAGWPFYALHLQRTLATPRAIRSIRARGLRVGVWTVNDPADWQVLVELGVDWVITDSPGRMLRGRL